MTGKYVFLLLTGEQKTAEKTLPRKRLTSSCSAAHPPGRLERGMRMSVRLHGSWSIAWLTSRPSTSAFCMAYRYWKLHVSDWPTYTYIIFCNERLFLTVTSLLVLLSKCSSASVPPSPSRSSSVPTSAPGIWSWSPRKSCPPSSLCAVCVPFYSAPLVSGNRLSSIMSLFVLYVHTAARYLYIYTKSAGLTEGFDELNIDSNFSMLNIHLCGDSAFSTLYIETKVW